MPKPALLLCLLAGAAASTDSVSLLQVAAERKPTQTRLTEDVKHVKHVKHAKHAKHEESHIHAHHAKHEDSEEMQLVKEWAKDEGLPHVLPGHGLSEIPDLAWPPSDKEEADPEAFANAVSKAAAEADSVLEPANPGEAAEEALAPVTDITGIARTVNVADFAQGLAGMDQAAYEAAAHKINQGGYMKIVRLRNTSLMESFIALTVLANGGLVKDPQVVAELAPEHSGEQGAENFDKLLAQVKDGAWNTVGEDVAAEDVSRRAPLDSDGYEMVAALHDTEKMSQFIRRVIEANAGTLVDTRKIEWYAKYYSGEKATQSFKQMVHQLKLVDWVTGMKPLHTKSQDPLPDQ